MGASQQADIQDPDEERLKLDYQWTNEQIKLLTDIRFRLLVWLPPLVAFAVPLILGSASSTPPSSMSIIALGVLGLSVTLGIVVYELRNSMLYNAHIHRASLIEHQLKIPTLVWSNDNDSVSERLHGGVHALRVRNDPRLDKLSFAGLTVNHGTALGIVYSALLSSWVFAIAKGALVVILSWVKFYVGDAALFSGTGNTTAFLALLIAGEAFVFFKSQFKAFDEKGNGLAQNQIYQQGNHAHGLLRQPPRDFEKGDRGIHENPPSPSRN
jgi:hypothetical protein